MVKFVRENWVWVVVPVVLVAVGVLVLVWMDPGAGEAPFVYPLF